VHGQLKHPSWGWSRAHDAAKAISWRVNHNRIQRLWREEGPKVPYGRTAGSNHSTRDYATSSWTANSSTV